ncbi:MAG: hypothetical protein H7246_09310 [Phycisphaerae bacterium]|nr:hypothetical protein [Saprospiraceae bacterium]
MTSFLISLSSALQIFGVLITLAAAAAMGYIEHNKLTPNKKNFGYLALFGGILALVGQYYSTKDNDNKTEIIIEQGKKIDSLSVVNVFLSRGNSTKLDQSLSQLDSIIDNSIITFGKLERQSNKLSDVYQKAKQIQDYNTGGNSFGVVTAINVIKTNFSFFIENKGNYPLYKLNIVIFEEGDHHTQRKAIVNTLGDMKNTAYENSTYNIDVLKPNDPYYLGDIEIPAYKDSINYRIIYESNNGNIQEALIALKDKLYNTWTFAVQVKRNNKVVYEEIEADFPHRSKEINWHNW